MWQQARYKDVLLTSHEHICGRPPRWEPLSARVDPLVWLTREVSRPREVAGGAPHEHESILILTVGGSALVVHGIGTFVSSSGKLVVIAVSVAAAAAIAAEIVSLPLS